MNRSMTSRAAYASNRRGAMLVFVAVVLILLFVAATLAIDIAHMHMVRAELRTATDAAARAGAESLGRVQNSSRAIQAAIDIAAENQVGGDPLLLRRSDVVLGRNESDGSGGFAFTAGGRPFNAVQVTGRRQDGSPSGAVPLIFGPMFGVNKFQPVQVAIAGRLDRDIALVLDVSGSMGDLGKFPALTVALGVFLRELSQSPQDEYVSLTTYSSTATKLQALTPNLTLIDNAFAQMSPNGMTAIGLGMDTGITSLLNDPLRRDLVDRSVILMTDGIHNTGVNPLAIVPRAQANKIVVHTITFGADANQALMRLDRRLQ